MDLIYPNQPVEVFPDSLDDLDDGTSFAQSKVDGYRCLLMRDPSHNIIKSYDGSESWDMGDGYFFLSRRGVNKGGPTRLDVSEEIIQEVRELGLPINTMIDAEWLERRTKKDGIGECLYAHDILWLEDHWLGQIDCWKRFNTLTCLFSSLGSVVKVVDHVEKGFRKFFEQQKQTPWCEGIVIKDKNHKIKGSRKECQKNGLWQKIKWRGGSSGRKLFY